MPSKKVSSRDSTAAANRVLRRSSNGIRITSGQRAALSTTKKTKSTSANSR